MIDCNDVKLTSFTYFYKPDDKPIGWKHVVILLGKNSRFFSNKTVVLYGVMYYTVNRTSGLT